MKAKKKEKSKNLKLAAYFGIVIFLIILVSLAFKTFDMIRKSKFDGTNRFTVAVLNTNNAELISVSPEEGTIAVLHLSGVNNAGDIRGTSLPVDAYIDTNANENFGIKSFFIKTLFRFNSVKTDLTLIDLARLSVYSSSIDSEKIDEESVSYEDDRKISSLGSVLFIDPTISNEKINIQITNSTNVGGLGNKVAKYVTNLGGSVVLVNTSQDIVEKSKIFYKNESYTLKKMSKALGIPIERRNNSSISDVIIVIGKDREDLLN